MNRATIAFLGAVFLVAIDAITMEEASNAVDLDSITLLLALMIMNVNFRLSGFFSLIIGNSSMIPFAQFMVHLLPVAIIGMAVVWAIIYFTYRKEFAYHELATAITPEYRIYNPLFRKSIFSAGILVVALFSCVPTTLSAIAATSVLLITRRLKPERVFAEGVPGMLIH